MVSYKGAIKLWCFIIWATRKSTTFLASPERGATGRGDWAEELGVPLDTPTPSLDDLRSLFSAAYFKRFQVELPEIRPALVNVNCSVVGRRPEIDLGLLIDASGRKDSLALARTGSRQVWFGGWHDTPVYRRDHLPAEASLEGPAIIEQMDTTIVLEPGDVAAQDGDGNIIITLGGAA